MTRVALGAWLRTMLAAASIVAIAFSGMAVGGCAPLADYIQQVSNKTEKAPEPPSAEAKAFHSTLLVADLHADTMLWRRGLTTNNPDGQVDLRRMVQGNLGLQIFTMPTRVPIGINCIDGRNFDPAPLLAMVNGWPRPTWGSAFERAFYQAEALRMATTGLVAGTPVSLTLIKTKDDMVRWLAARYETGVPDPHKIGVLLGVEGAHAFDGPDGPQFERLFELGLRMVAPMHRFDNLYGGSSQGCSAGGLTKKGVRLINVAFERRMIVDLAHASKSAFEQAITVLGKAEHPAVISHSGLQSYLGEKGGLDGHRANSDKELIRLSQIGGVFGIGFWPAAIGTASVDHIVGTILRALEVLRRVQGAAPQNGGFHTVKNASEHVALGSDWDGYVTVAIDPGNLAVITERLLKHLAPQDVANIMGLNTCRVIVQSLGADDFKAARDTCRIAHPTNLRNVLVDGSLFRK